MGLLDGGQSRHQGHLKPHGDVLAKTGSVRDGGSYENRMGGIACWNAAVMDENNYSMVQKMERVCCGLIGQLLS
jgi:putative spermidine/putrescine transport system substrate-binding protein